MPKDILGTVIKIVLASLVLGFILKFLDIKPTELWKDFGGTIKRAFDWAGDFVAGSIEYVLVGAVIVVPIWAIVFLIGKIRGR